MNIQSLYDEIKQLKARIEARGLDADLDIDFDEGGTEVSLTLHASEHWDINGYWRRGKTFEGNAADIQALIDQAHGWVTALPEAENRALEFTIQKLAEIANKLPAARSGAMKQAMELVKSYLLNKAADLAKRGLPAPHMVSDDA